MSISKKTLRYKDFEGSIEVDLDDDLLYGQILFINDVITYEGENLYELKKAFKNMVDEYIKYCEELGVKPQKTYSGSFNIRPGAEIHKKLVQEAELNGETLNQLIKNIFKKYFEEKEQKEFPINSYSCLSNSYLQQYFGCNNKTGYSWTYAPREIYLQKSKIFSPHNVNTRLYANNNEVLNNIIFNYKNRVK